MEQQPAPAGPAAAAGTHLGQPHYDPMEVQKLAADIGARRLTRSALDGCLELGLAPNMVWETLASLGSGDCRFIKTVDSDKRPGEKLDVYDALVCGKHVYVKIKCTHTHATSKLLVVLSFKRNEYYDRTMH